MGTELFANNPSTTVSSGGNTAPVAGTSETWLVADSSDFPSVSPTATPPTWFRIVDPEVPDEVILVTHTVGATWTVTRGAEGTAPALHAPGFTVYGVVTAAALRAFLQSPLTTLGDTVYEDATLTPVRLPGNTAATRKFLRQTGTGTVSAVPAWDTIIAGDLPAATSGAEGVVQLTGDLGGTAASPQVVGTHLSSALPVAQGGTGLTANGARGQVLSAGASAPVWASAPVDWLNVVTGYGADPTGAADSTTAIQAALTAGGTVYLPKGTYKTTATLYMGANTWLMGAGWQQTVIQPTSALGAAPAIAVVGSAYTSAGPQANLYSKLSDFEIILSSAPNAVGIYYDHVASIVESQTVVRFGQCGRVIGWANGLTWTNVYSYNQTDSFWKWFHTYSTSAPWDTANSGSTVGGGGSTYSDPANFMLYNPFNYITTAAAAGTVNAFFTIRSGEDFQIISGHSLRTPGVATYITNGVNIDYSWDASVHQCDFFTDGHEFDALWDGTGGSGPFKGSGACVLVNNANLLRFGPNSWVGPYSATDNAEMWAVHLINSSDIVFATGGHYSGRGFLLDGVNSKIVMRGQCPQPLGDPVVSSAAAGTLDSSMNGLSLPQSSIAVDNMTGTLPATGSLVIATGSSPSQVTYTGFGVVGSVTTFTGCTGGGNVLSTGGVVVLRSVSSSVFAPDYTGSFTDNPETLAALINGSQASQLTPANFCGSAITSALLVSRAWDGKAWGFALDSSNTGTLTLKNPEGSVKLQVSDGGNLVISGNADILGGLLTSKIVTQTNNYTLALTDLTVLANAAGGAFTLTLPTAVGATGQRYTMKKIDSSGNAVTIATTSAQTIDGASTATLPRQWSQITVMSDGANWQNISTAGLATSTLWKKTATVTPSATLGTYGTAVVLIAGTGASYINPAALFSVSTGLGSETVTVQYVATFDDASTSTGTFTVSSNVTTNLTANQLALLFKDNRSLVSVTVSVQSTINSSAASVAFTVMGANTI